MKLIVPYVGEIAGGDARLIRLAEFLGIDCQPIALSEAGAEGVEAFGIASIDRSTACLVINPRVLEAWTGGRSPSNELLSSLVSTYKYVMVHAVSPSEFDSRIVADLSGDQLQGVKETDDSSATLDVAPDASDICEAFRGLSLGSAVPDNDRVFLCADESSVRRLITIKGKAFLACMRRDECEILFVGSQDVVDIDSEAGDEWLLEYFSRFMPQAMVLRHIFGSECWRPISHHACVIVDDPLLRANYGFLNFKHLLQLMEEHNFHTTIAFIPHNCRRTSSKTATLFREHSNRLSLCVHGNDHTGGEFASTDPNMLDSILHIANRRMQMHAKLSGLSCDRVMVFPQGGFSIEAMEAMKGHDFDAAVNTVPHPRQQETRLTLRELAQPSVIRYAGFPLFLRKNSLKTQTPDIAFKLFFGIPVLIVEHHDVFKNPESLIQAVKRINSAEPNIRWSSVGEAVKSAVLCRRGSAGSMQFRGYSRTIRFELPSKIAAESTIEWNLPHAARYLGVVRRNGVPLTEVQVTDSRVQVSASLKPESPEILSIQPRAMSAPPIRMSFKYSTRAFVRRRLSEIRDNYISKSPALLAAAKAVQKSLHH